MLQEDYGRMLSYYCQGIQDPHRPEMLDNLMDKAWSLADQLDDSMHPAPEEAVMGDLCEKLSDLHQNPYEDSLLFYVFEHIADCHHLHREERKALHQAILEEELPEYVRATLLGAVTLHLLQWFDAELVENLYIYTFDELSTQLRMRAWVTLVFVAIIHSDRIEHLPRLREQYQLMIENDPDQLYDIQIAMLQCREALTFDKKLNEIVRGGNENEDPKEENVKEFISFISQGIDMSLSTFTHLKDLRFFSAARTHHHWLEPFALEQPAVKEILEQLPESLTWTQMLLQSAAQCETDRYSTFFSMHEMNPRLMSNISKKLQETGLPFDHIAPLSPLCVMRNYLHDLFRYCHLHPLGGKMRVKPFSQQLLLSQNIWLKPAFTDPDRLQKIAEMLYLKGRWDEAVVAYLELLKYEKTEKSMQRLCYVAMNAADPSNGVDIVEWLVRCNKTFPGSKWTEKNLADLLHAQGTFDSEEQCLQEALTHHIKDVGLLTRMGRCQISLGHPKEALEYLYQAEEEKEGQMKVQREMARAFFETQDHEKAELYIRKVLSRPSPTPADWLLGGHIALMNDDVPLALERYMQGDFGEVEHSLSAPTESVPFCRAGIDNYTRQLALGSLQQLKRAQDDKIDNN